MVNLIKGINFWILKFLGIGIYEWKNCRDNLQCSEICGIYHGFMPIVVEAVSSPDFLVWVDSASQ
jgi:heme/copper-type cytochrome/quinol oxidase subunit 2